MRKFLSEQRDHIAFLLALVVICTASGTNVIETGMPDGEDFTLTAGSVVKSSVDLPGWEAVTSCIIENMSTTGSCVVGLRLRSKYREFEVLPGKTLNMPAEFLSMNKIRALPAGSKPDTVAYCVSGTAKLYVFGG